MKTKDLSVFFPCVNEAENIENTVKKAVEILESLKLNYEIIVVNDGSKDNTEEVVKRLEKENSRIRLINHPVNLGYGEALKSGFYNARYATICYTDGDGQFDFSEITKFLEKIEEDDVVIGFRIKRKDPLFRILFAKGWAFALFIFFRLGLKDIDCGFKMVKRSVLERIEALQSQRGAMINAELVIKAKKAGFKIGQVGVNHYPRTAGKPTGANIKVIFKSFIDLFKLWWKLKQGKNFFLIFLLILSLSFAMRVYRISEYMTFLGDEGRDALIIKDMIDGKHLPLIGAPTSIGNIYLGPFYYYMMYVSMVLIGGSPIGAAVMNALIGSATVALVYLLGKLLFNKTSALVSAMLYGISPIAITYSRTSWNPNPASFFALINMLSIYLLNKSGNFYWMILSGLSLSAAIQMHYLAVILIPITFVLWLYEIILRKKEKKEIKNLTKGTLLGILAFCILVSPLIIFDLKHNFMNYRALVKLFTRSGAIKADPFSSIIRIGWIYSHALVGRYLTAENLYMTPVAELLFLVALLRKNWSSILLGVWLGIGILGLSFYKENIYDHYLGFLNPVAFLLIGSFFSIKKIEKNMILKIISFFIIGFLIYLNLSISPLLQAPQNQLGKTQNVAKYIISQTNGEDFNFALISKNNYDAAYQYYLDVYNHKPKTVPDNITNQLIVVCEDPVCDPTHNSKYEVVAFGWSKIVWEQNIFGVRVYKLKHNPSGKP